MTGLTLSAVRRISKRIFRQANTASVVEKVIHLSHFDKFFRQTEGYVDRCLVTGSVLIHWTN